MKIAALLPNRWLELPVLELDQLRFDEVSLFWCHCR
jgi:hypothetical protein